MKGAAEAVETRKNSVTAREWEVALPSEISGAERSAIARGFAQALVERYSVVADVAIHAPHREGDQRNHHAHILTTTRRLEPGGFTEKTRELDAKHTGGAGDRAHTQGLGRVAERGAGAIGAGAGARRRGTGWRSGMGTRGSRQSRGGTK